MFKTDHQHWPLRPTYGRLAPSPEGIELDAPVETARLVIRAGTEADVGPCARGIAAADMPWLGLPQARDRAGEVTDIFIDGIRHALLRHGRMLVVTDKSGAAAGALAVSVFEPGTVQASWAMFRGFESDRYAGEALDALIGHLLALEGVQRVVLRIPKSPGKGPDPMVETATALGLDEIPAESALNPYERKGLAIAAYEARRGAWPRRPS